MCKHNEYFYVAPFESDGGTYVWYIMCEDCGRCLWIYIKPYDKWIALNRQMDERGWFYADERTNSGSYPDDPKSLVKDNWRMPDELIFKP